MLISLAQGFVNAQMVSMPSRIYTPRGNVTINTPMPGTQPYYQYGNRNSNYVPTIYYTVYLKDGTKFTGVGSFSNRPKDPYIRVDYFGQKRPIRPQETTKITFGKDSTYTEMISFDNDWVANYKCGSKDFYQTIVNDKKAYIKEGDNFRELGKEEVIEIVKESDEAVNKAQKGQIQSALREFYTPTALVNNNTLPSATFGAKSKEKFNIIYKNDSTVSGEGVIENKYDHYQLTIQNTLKQKISVKPDETKLIEKIVKGKTIEGVPYKNRYWLFKTFVGEIIGYSVDAERPTLFAVKVGNEIKLASKDLILKMVAGNESAEKQAKNGYFEAAIEKFNHSK